MKITPNARRVNAWRSRARERGLVKLELWVYPESIAFVKRAAESANRNAAGQRAGEISGDSDAVLD